MTLNTLFYIAIGIWIVSVEVRLDAIGGWQEIVNAIFRRGKERAEEYQRELQRELQREQNERKS